jgi:hypothetical protein
MSWTGHIRDVSMAGVTVVGLSEEQVREIVRDEIKRELARREAEQKPAA